MTAACSHGVYTCVLLFVQMNMVPSGIWTFLQKYDIFPHVQLQTIVRLFYGGFGAVASSLLSGVSGYVDIGIVLLWI